VLAAGLLALAGCGDKDAPAAPDNARLLTPAAVLAAFRNDLSICTAIVKTMKADAGFLKAFIPLETRQAKSREALLRESPFAKTPEYQHVIDHPQYFFVGVSHHGDPFAEAWVEDEAVFCGPTLQRLKYIEALGESAEAWSVREYFLDKLLESLSHPSDEGSGGIEFETLEPFVREAADIYDGPMRPRFLAWAQKAAVTVDAGRSAIVAGAAGLGAEEQHRMLDERIAVLRGFEQAAAKP